MSVLTQKIAVLGEGLTGQAVRDFLQSRSIKESSLDDADLLVVSPGIPPRKFPKTSAEIISELEFAFRVMKEESSLPYIIAVTGTNGKSTVTSMLAHVLGIPYAGNIGVPLVNFCNEPPKTIVVECSSYQLETTKAFHAPISVFTSLTPDHLDWHEGMDNYKLSKKKLLQKCTQKDLVIYESGNKGLAEMLSSCSAMKIPCEIADKDANLWANSFLMGPHNVLNALYTIKVARAFGLSDKVIKSRLATYKALAHRLEICENSVARKIYNDSKSTNLVSTLVAVNAFNEPIHLIMCGTDKGEDMKPFLTAIKDKCHSVVLCGEISSRFMEIYNEGAFGFSVEEVDSVELALSASLKRSKEGEAIVFSPGGASFDVYENFEKRGDHFKALAKALTL